MKTKFKTFYERYQTGEMYGKNGEQTTYLEACISKIEKQIREFIKEQQDKEKKCFTPISVSDIVVGDTFARTVLFEINE